jgi:hypothetical protein
MPNAWITALKQFNEGDTWFIPKKGTAAYKMVKDLMVITPKEPKVKVIKESKPKKVKIVKEPKTYGGMMRKLNKQLVKAEAECENVDAIKNKIRMLENS